MSGQKFWNRDRTRWVQVDVSPIFGSPAYELQINEYVRRGDGVMVVETYTESEPTELLEAVEDAEDSIAGLQVAREIGGAA